MKLISETKLIELLIRSEKLALLENGGVDNWINYDEALKNFREWEDSNEPSKLLDNYVSYNLTEEENYNYD